MRVTVPKFTQSFAKTRLNGSVTLVWWSCWAIQGPMEQLDIAVHLGLNRTRIITWDLLILHLRLQRRDPKPSCG